jgi:iron complex transport system ATP-binding protein
MILNVDGVEFGYPGRPVLKDVSFTVTPEDFVAILGPNGVGKTTLLRCVNALLRPGAGSVLLEDRDILAMSRLEIAREMAYVSQRSQPPRMTAFDAVLLGRRPHIGFDVGPRDIAITEAILGRLDLDDLALRYVDEMSGGELQKVAIARALVQEPRILLLDEPTSSLDLKNQLEILGLVRDVVRDHRVAALTTMHDLNLALRFADRFILMKGGAIHAAGGPEVVTAETIGAVYDVPVSVERFSGYRVVVPCI